MRKQALNGDEIATITNGLRIAAESYHAHGEEMTKLAAHLRAGKEHGLFAPGEKGAVVADRLKEQFEEQEKDTRALMDRFEGADEIFIRFEEEERQSA